MDYLDLVEEYSDDKKISQFEKVRVLANRARDLYEGKTCKVDNLDDRKPTTKAQYEVFEEKIEPHIYLEEKEVNYDDYLDVDDEDSDD
jgi:DNA-directed RNA polymerase subunit K/omega